MDGWKKAKQGQVENFEFTAFFFNCANMVPQSYHRVTTSLNETILYCLLGQTMARCSKQKKNKPKEHALDMAIAEYKYLQIKKYLTNTV